MEERWWALVWMVGSVAGYLAFMRYHPLRTAFASAFELARNNLTIVGGLALLFVGAVGWRSWQETGLGSENTVAFSVTAWVDLLGWLAYANEDLRSVFWFCVPVDVVFILGTPLAFLTCWYWFPRLWRACPGPWRGLAGGLFALYALSLWWWLQRLAGVLKLAWEPVPAWPLLRSGLEVLAESGFAVILACFFQWVLLLGAYRSHGSGHARCQLKEAADWALKFFPRMAVIALMVLVGMGLSSLAENWLDAQAAHYWDAAKFGALLVTAAMPICVLLLQDLNPWESLLASFRFLFRTAWFYLWFVFICLTHFFLLRLSESYFLASVLTHEVAVIAWYVVAGLVKAALVIWFVNAFCLYFCVDVTQRQRRGKASTSTKPMKLTLLQARTASRRRRFFKRP
jgi:hypothetical protein